MLSGAKLFFSFPAHFPFINSTSFSTSASFAYALFPFSLCVYFRINESIRIALSALWEMVSPWAHLAIYHWRFPLFTRLFFTRIIFMSIFFRVCYGLGIILWKLIVWFGESFVLYNRMYQKSIMIQKFFISWFSLFINDNNKFIN